MGLSDPNVNNFPLNFTRSFLKAGAEITWSGKVTRLQPGRYKSRILARGKKSFSSPKRPDRLCFLQNGHRGLFLEG